MDFRSLQYFVVTAQELNITRAASLLNISQPPLSSQIHSLEEEFGTRLFIRSRNGLTLTATGSILYKRAKQILELGRHTHEEIQNYEIDLSGDLKIGTVEGRAPFLLARLIAGFRDEFPLVTYTVRSGGSDEILDQLHHHLIDIAVIAAPYDQESLDGLPLGRQPWVAIIPGDHPLASAQGNGVSLSDLADEPLIIPERSSRVRSIEEWFAGSGLTPHFLCKTSNYINAISLVEQNIGICIFPQSTYTPNPHVVTKLIRDPAKIAEYYLVTQKDAPVSELAEAFRDYAADFLLEDRFDSPRFRTKEEEFDIPGDADLL
jgi:DNA-binding transcriptional LysR family regulator